MFSWGAPRQRLRGRVLELLSSFGAAYYKGNTIISTSFLLSGLGAVLCRASRNYLGNKEQDDAIRSAITKGEEKAINKRATEICDIIINSRAKEGVAVLGDSH